MISLREISLGHRTWPYATAGVDPVRKIPPSIWTILERALVPPPCAYGLLPWVFLIVGDPQVRARLLSAATGLEPLSGCSHFVVFARNTTMSEADVEKFLHRATAGHSAQHGAFRVYSVARSREGGGDARGISLEEWTGRQAYVALADLMTAANLLDVDACPIDGLDPAEYDEALGLTAKGYSAVCACALGYSANGERNAHLPQTPIFLP